MNAFKNDLIIKVDEQLCLALRSANASDQEILRNWKNGQREFFFYKEVINPEQQELWFIDYMSRQNDHMFIVEVANDSIGCMGIRLLDKGWDIYNVILGQTEFGRRGLMSKAFNSMICYALSVCELPIMLQVLKINPAVAWYINNGFYIFTECDDHYCMTYHRNTNIGG